MRTLLYAGLTGLLLLPVTARAALPGDAADGKSLHDVYCTGCHDTSVYTRQDRRVRSLDALRRQVQNCQRAAGTDFSTSEMQNLLKYLNERFYRFP
jgi:hypothetical protein